MNNAIETRRLANFPNVYFDVFTHEVRIHHATTDRFLGGVTRHGGLVKVVTGNSMTGVSYALIQEAVAALPPLSAI